MTGQTTERAGATFVRVSMPQAVANHLRGIILRGDFGDRLPGERPLSEMLRVSRPSLRLALQLLTEEGLLDRRQGHTTRIVTSGRDPGSDTNLHSIRGAFGGEP